MVLLVVYVMVCCIDDVGDGMLLVEEKLWLLVEVCEGVTAFVEHLGDLVFIVFDDVVWCLFILFDVFGLFVDGCEMDVIGCIYELLDEFVEYCCCVVGSIGWFLLGVFNLLLSAVGLTCAAELVDAFGVVLQLTNILCDIWEDFGNGWVYFFKQDFGLFGCELVLLFDGIFDL